MSDPKVCRDKLGRGEEYWSLIPAGSFTMGSEEGQNDGRPVRTKKLDAYCAAKYEISNKDWAKYEAANQRRGDCTRPKSERVCTIYFRGIVLSPVEEEIPSPKGFDAPNQPRVNISWSEARDYCQWLGGDLFTEAQWENAGKGGKDLEYPTASGGINKDLANYRYFFGKTEAVDSYPTNPYGLHNMAGNAWEWVLDTYDDSAYTYLSDSNPVNLKEGPIKVLRGGGWSSDESDLRAAYRSGNNAAVRRNVIGARCALPPQDSLPAGQAGSK